MPAYTPTNYTTEVTNVLLNKGENGIAAAQADADTANAALPAKAPLASPALTGTPTAPTPATADNSTKIATTAFVKNQGYSTGGGGGGSLAVRDEGTTLTTAATSMNFVGANVNASVSGSDVTVSVGGSSGGGMYINVVTDYGADPTGTNDSTTAIQNAINAVPQPPWPQPLGAIIYFPRGQYKVNGRLNLTNKRSITFQGEGRPLFVGIGYQASSIVFNASGKEALVDCRGCQSACFDGMGFYYTSPTFEGDMFNFARFVNLGPPVTVAGDAGRVRFIACTLSGDAVDDFVHIADTNKAIWARSLINFQESIFNSVIDCHLGFARRHVIGKWADPVLPVGQRPYGDDWPRLDPSKGQYDTTNYYSHAMWFQGCEFNGAGIASIVSPAENWSFDNCGWEFHHGMRYGILHQASDPILQGSPARGFRCESSWIGDALGADYTTLAASMTSGATTIQVTSAANLAVGQNLTIGDFNRESRSITAISGTTITLASGANGGTMAARNAGEQVHNFWGNEAFFYNDGQLVYGGSFTGGIMVTDIPAYKSRSGSQDMGVAFQGDFSITNPNALSRPMLDFGGNVSIAGINVQGANFQSHTGTSWITGHTNAAAGSVWARGNSAGGGVAGTLG